MTEAEFRRPRSVRPLHLADDQGISDAPRQAQQRDLDLVLLLQVGGEQRGRELEPGDRRALEKVDAPGVHRRDAELHQFQQRSGNRAEELGEIDLAAGRGEPAVDGETHVERLPVRVRLQIGDELGGCRVAQPNGQVVGNRRSIQWRQGEAAGATTQGEFGGAPCRLAPGLPGTDRAHQQQTHRGGQAREIIQPLQGRRISPLQVLEDQHDRTGFAQRRDRLRQLEQHLVFAGRRVERRRTVARQQLRKRCAPGRRPSRHGANHIVCTGGARAAAQRVEERKIRLGDVALAEALPAQHRGAAGRALVCRKGLDQQRLADSALAEHEDDLTTPLERQL